MLPRHSDAPHCAAPTLQRPSLCCHGVTLPSTVCSPGVAIPFIVLPWRSGGIFWSFLISVRHLRPRTAPSLFFWLSAYRAHCPPNGIKMLCKSINPNCAHPCIKLDTYNNAAPRVLVPVSAWCRGVSMPFLVLPRRCDALDCAAPTFPCPSLVCPGVANAYHCAALVLQCPSLCCRGVPMLFIVLPQRSDTRNVAAPNVFAHAVVA